MNLNLGPRVKIGHFITHFSICMEILRVSSNLALAGNVERFVINIYGIL